eukprot:TRINITY_DN39079_c0_g1_i1.p1 TRINITY_DN39079_c0_g1~~TRINITY_DN39079_c0_g1_i1.p1  ORF type:complete len:844 (+),score=200.41 TRINITY_DN39079_c0_g1_i1:389-2920(+)
MLCRGTPSSMEKDVHKKESRVFRRLHVLAWYCLCLSVHFASVFSDVGVLGVTFAGMVSAASAAIQRPTFGTGASFSSAGIRGGSAVPRGGVIRRVPGSKRLCNDCSGFVLYEGWQMPGSVVTWQLISDVVAVVAYLSVPVQLYYFVKASKRVHFKLVLLQFGAFFTMCGLSHLISLLTYGGLPRLLMLAMAAAKIMTAFVSCTLAFTLAGVAPDLFGVHDREVFLREKTQEEDKEVVELLRQEALSDRLYDLITAVKRTLDIATISLTACAELKALLKLENVVLWLPTAAGDVLELACDSERNLAPGTREKVETDDPTVKEIVTGGKITVIAEGTVLAERSASSLGAGAGAGITVAAVPLPLLSSADIAAGPTASLAASQSVSFALLVMLMPTQDGREWQGEDLGVAESVADELAVALAHGVVLEEAERRRDQLLQEENSLRLAEFEGKSAVRAREHFLTVMKHEMRTPMQTMTLSSVLAEMDLEDKQRAMVETVARSSALLDILVSDIPDFWRLEDDSVSLTLAAFDLPVLVKEAETLVAPIAKEKGVKLAFKVEANLPKRVTGDSNRILQVVLNVVNNSIQATEEGGSVNVNVVTEQIHSARNGFVLKAEAGFVFVRFEVKDTGVELKEKDIPRLFEKFQDDDGTMSRTGLGMALSRKFVDLSEGHIWIESGGAKGGATTRFILRLKLEEEDGEEEAEEEEWVVPEVNFYALRFLVVDDSRLNRMVTKKMLESIGSRAQVADGGKECVRLLKERPEDEDPYDVLLLDIMMPEMDGYATAKKILEEVPEEKRPIIVALTANAGEATREKCLEHGMLDMITKPISLNPLRDVLGKLLDTNARR